MLRRIVIACLAAGFAVPGAAAAPTTLMPGVTYERDIQFTSHGPVVMHVLTAPRPGGLYDLRPELSNGVIPGLERLTSIERRISPQATVAGVSGDEQTSGLNLRGGVLGSRPLSGQSSIGIDASGNLHVERVAFFATWAGTGARHPGIALNQLPTTNGITLYTPVWGPTTPAATDTVEAVLPSFPAVASNVDVSGAVSLLRTGGGTAIPPAGAVLVARGTAAQSLTAEAPAGSRVTVHMLLGSGWSQFPNGMGGGPLLVRGGRPVFRAGEQFSIDQLALRQGRCAVGQRADGSILLVTVDGGQPGYSAGMTNLELAQSLARLHAVTAAGLSIGNSAAMAFEGTLLSRPSGLAGERAVADALLVSYSGVQVTQPDGTVVSPNGDGFADIQPLAYKVVRPSTVTAELVGPGRAIQYSSGTSRLPGTYRFAFPGEGFPPPTEGLWRWVVTAVDDAGRTSKAERSFVVNNTLGYLQLDQAVVPRRGRLAIGFKLSRAARVTAAIERRTGILARTLLSSVQEPAGDVALAWDGRNSRRQAVAPGRYRVRITASSELGRVDVTRDFVVSAG